MRTRALEIRHVGAWLVRLGMLLVLCMTVGLHAASKQAVTRGAPQAIGIPNPSAFKNEREASEYLTALEHQNKVLTTRLGELESSTTALSSTLKDKETRLVQLSQALGEKEQLVATILANEDALSEALAMRDERVALLEETLNNLKARANRTVEIEDRHQQLAHAYNDLQSKLEPAQRKLATEQEARREVAAAYEELQLQRAQLDTALAEANLALIDMDTELTRLSSSQQSEKQSHQELIIAHQVLRKQYELEKQAHSEATAQLAALRQERDATTHELHTARLTLTELQDRINDAHGQLTSLTATRATEHAQLEVNELAHAELTEAYQRLVTNSRLLENDLRALAEHNEQVENQLAAEGERMATLARRYEELEHRYKAHGSTLAQAEARIEALCMAHSQEEKQWDMQKNAHSELIETYTALSNAHEQVKSQLKTTNAQCQELSTELMAVQAAYAASDAERDQEQAAHYELVEAYQILSGRFYEQENALMAATIQFQELQVATSRQQDQHRELVEASALLTDSHAQLKEKIFLANTQCQDLAEQLAAAQAARDKSNAERDQETAAHLELVEAYQILSGRFYEQENALTAATTELSKLIAVRDIEHAQWNKQELAHTELVGAYAELARSHQGATRDLAALQEERLALKETLAQAQRAQSLEAAQWDVQEQAHSELVSAYREVSAQCCEQECALTELRESLETTTHALTAVRTELQDRTQQLHNHMNEHAALAQQSQGLVMTNHSLEEQLESLAQLSRDRDSAVLAARNEATQLKGQLKELSHSWQALDAQKQSLAVQLTRFEGIEIILDEVQTELKRRDDTITQLTATNHDQQTALSSLQRTRDSLAKELSDLKAFQGALLQWEAEKLATARTAVTPQGRSLVDRGQSIATRIHIVSPGETLSTIAQDYNKSIQDLYNANSDSIPNQNQVRIGTALVIP